MFRCGLRLPTKAPIQRYSLSGALSLRVKSNTAEDVTWTLHKNYAFDCTQVSRRCTPRHFDTGFGESEQQCFRGLGSRCFFSTLLTRRQLTHNGRNTSLALAVKSTIQYVSHHMKVVPGYRTWVNRPHGRETFYIMNELEPILFTSGAKLCTRPFYTTTVQAIASSAASQKRETGAEDATTTPVNMDQVSSESPRAVIQESDPDSQKPNKMQQLKKVFKEYGAVGVSFHIGMSLMSLGMFYLAVSSGIDMAAVLCKMGFSESIVQSKMAAGTSTFVLAYAIHKLFAPVRISITLVSVPLIVRYLRKTGLFKPPAPSP
ncbi:protein FAM210B, mitochondrial [Chanos chanos]|uniref:Protein FAM210B, mitochondrial n=1 Tax=Chanos chanos TaxID=29144 RepID=A0A6J2VUX2_CHACN|nr:protein FAM210B, mitochondrial [Chanos chanos]